MLLGLGVMANAESIAERQANQRARIRQGVQSGELTKPEAARLRQEARQVHRQTQRNRADGGELNGRERARLQAELNQNGRAIRRMKHNDRER
jgi:hypothetical protein